MIEALKKLFFISRPISWPNTAYPFAAGYLLTGGAIDATLIVATLYFLGPYNLLMYGINDVFDYESDIKNPRKGGIEGMREQRKFHPTIVRAALISNVPFIIWLIATGSVVSAVTLLAVVFFVVAYSVAGLRFKEKPVLDSITSSLHFVGPLIYALSLTDSLAPALVYVIAFFCWGMASHAFGAVQDIIPDRKGKIASIATVLGARTTVWFALVLYLIPVVLTAWQQQWAVAVVGMIYVVNVWPYLRITDQTSGRSNEGWRRFIWLNYLAGFIITLVLIVEFIAS